MEKIIQAMQEMAARGEPFTLATVISRDGSAPRSAGAKMLVRGDGSFVGTVGGGILEANVLKLAAQVCEKHSAVIQNFAFSGKDASVMDAICGGQVDVLVEWMDAKDPLTVSIIEQTAEILQNRKTGWLVTRLAQNSATTAHALALPDGSILGTLPDNLAFDTVRGTNVMSKLEDQNSTTVIEPVNIVGAAYIFGAGHVSQSLAEFTKAVGFWTVVLDDRPEFCNRERFATADELIVLDSFDNSVSKLPVDQNSFIVIITRGHMNDAEVLAQALRTSAGYIGMIGSKRKVKLVFDKLLEEGFSEEEFKRVHAPIGIPIEAETPEEIGVSITAEMIQVRARMQR